MGPNSLMVVYVDPLGLAFRDQRQGSFYTSWGGYGIPYIYVERILFCSYCGLSNVYGAVGFRIYGVKGKVSPMIRETFLRFPMMNLKISVFFGGGGLYWVWSPFLSGSGLQDVWLRVWGVGLAV